MSETTTEPYCGRETENGSDAMGACVKMAAMMLKTLVLATW